MRPFVFLDLDGVLNPFAAPACPDGYQECVLYEGEEPQRYLGWITGTWIRDLAGAGELWWATAWGEDANTLFLPLFGLEPLPVVRFPPVPFEPELKVPAVAAVAGDQPAAWIDDNHTDAGRRWAAERTAATLLVSIDPAVGLDREDVDRVVAWAATLTG